MLIRMDPIGFQSFQSKTLLTFRAFRCNPLAQRVMSAASRIHAQAAALTWPEIEERASDASLDGYVKLPQASPSSKAPSAPGPGRVLETSVDSVWSAGMDENHPVLLLRDTDAWSPYCQRVWLALEYKGIPYDTMFINLGNKPKWFLELAPKGKLPVAKIKDKLLPESFDILKVLEEQFPQPALLPTEDELREEVLRVCGECEDFTNAGLGYMLERKAEDTEEAGTSGRTAKSAFEEQLDKLEKVVAQHGGPYIMGEGLTLADVMYAPNLERFSAQIPYNKDFQMRESPSYPCLAKWFATMDKLPAYQRVKSDDRTSQLLMRKFFGLKTEQVPKIDEPRRKARLEAAAKISQDHSAFMDNILKESGIVRVRSSQYGGTIRAFNGYPSAPGPALLDAVDHALRRVCHFLIEGTVGERHECVEACAIGSAALVFFRNSIFAPKDVSAAAAEEIRVACSQVLLDMF